MPFRGEVRQQPEIEVFELHEGEVWDETQVKFEITDIAVTEDGVEHYPLFCCQFLDSLYEPCGTVSGLPDAGEVNDLLRKASCGCPSGSLRTGVEPVDPTNTLPVW